MSEPLSVTDRLASALAVWDIQAHRSLTAHPNPNNLACVARVQALIATTTGVVAQAAVETGLIDNAAAVRFGTLIDTSQLAWTRTADRWSELIDPAARADPKLLAAASEVRAAVAAAAHVQTSCASAHLVAARVDIPTAISQLQLATAAAVDLAHVTRDIAVAEPTLTAPGPGDRDAHPVRYRADSRQGENRFLGVDWVTAGDVRANRLIPLPTPVRRGLVDAADQAIATAGQAAAAAITLMP